MPGTDLPKIEPVAPADWPALASFIHRHNQHADGGVRCLHAAQGDNVAQLAHELAALPPGEAAFWQVRDAGGAVDGLVGCEFDPALGRAWLRGPLVAGDPALRQPLLHRLVQALEDALDGTGEGAAGELKGELEGAVEVELPPMRCLDAFPAELDAPLNALYAARGYQRLGVHRVLEAALSATEPQQAALSGTEPQQAGFSGTGPQQAALSGGKPPQAPAWPLPLGISVRPAETADLAALLALHETLFPSSYLKPSDFAEAVGDASRRLLACCAADGSLLGYLHAKDDAEQPEIYIDYLGVAPEARGQGLGGALLAAALGWGRALGRPRASLTVREDRAAALALYERSGFRQVSAGMHWRRQRADPG
jgi:ribosomal protein S18 acetylase RimI-like enzyme